MTGDVLISGTLYRPPEHTANVEASDTRMRFWISGPRVFGIRPGISVSPNDFKTKPGAVSPWPPILFYSAAGMTIVIAAGAPEADIIDLLFLGVGIGAGTESGRVRL